MSQRDFPLVMKLALERFKTEFIRTFGELSDLDSPLKTMQMSKEDMCDVGFFCREIASIADDLRKEAKARSELAGKLLCMRAIEDMEPTTRGEYATGTSDGGLKPRLPKADSPEHAQLCDLFGVAEGKGREVVRFHWKTIRELMEQAAADGKEFPVKLQSSPDFKTVYRRKPTEN